MINTQLEVFIESLNPDILASWNPVTIPTTWRELVTTLRIHVQVRENLKQAQQNAKKKAVTPRSSSTTKSSSNTPKTTFSRALDPTKPWVYVTNPNSPTYQDRLSKGWCTRGRRAVEYRTIFPLFVGFFNVRILM
ncbi:hypothetical protein SeMB42_g01333 [Synchytrium endobioticum]|uniref:Uncharacterized protein n=1 Tax=Synchytrium endobioticum TaxID=286115 RepID=A0A507DLW0_9FUNG|nr:hypothetical protein SeLEV6574_g01614 [Synchytrium endobioticum]TPX52573.1 hypothetical protein SeMB42_g01333 [Synchytrium endobioticum]